MLPILRADRIVETSDRLTHRIAERFPDSGLGRVASQLQRVAENAAATEIWLGQPIFILRVVIWSTIVLLVALIALGLAVLPIRTDNINISDLFQGIEAVINNIFFIGVAIFFLIGVENRVKRRRALKALHELRALAHIVDMHQLTKDPERITTASLDTPSSPRHQMTPYELTRYLVYCTELLAIISKIAAIYAQDFDDPVVLEAGNDIENLTTGLSRKIWQKVLILDRILTGQPGPAADPLNEV